MPHKIKNWEKLQHYKNRRPPWIRLYRDVLDDPDFFDLSGDDFKTLVLLWLIASEDPLMQGYLPASKVLAFRLRVASTREMVKILERLNHWVILDASDMLATCLQDARPDQTRPDTETEKEVPKPKALTLPPVSKKSKYVQVEKPDEVPDQIWFDYLEMRKAKRSPLTPSALDAIAKEAAKVPIGLSEALQECCARGWQGFKAEWLQGASRGHQKKSSHSGFDKVDYREGINPDGTF